jgi:Domain of unknown function (DUF4399)
MRSMIARRGLLLAALLVPALAASMALAESTPAPKHVRLYFIWPQDGATVKGAFWCRFGLRNMGIAPAGVKRPDTGHHHLFVDVTEPLDTTSPIPNDKHHLHFGAGQTEAQLDLPPGPHTLQLVLGDSDHLPFDPPIVSKVIHITVLPRDDNNNKNPKVSTSEH